MDKKRFDHIEQQMKTAAEGWEPAFDEAAWDDMEQKLDGEKDRKSPFAWWLWLLPLILITGTAVYFMSTENTGSIQSAPTTASNQIKEKKELTNKENVNITGDTNRQKYTPEYAESDEIMKQFTQPKADKGSFRVKISNANASEDFVQDNEVSARKKIKDSQKGKTNMSVSGGFESEEEKTFNDEALNKTTEITNNSPVQKMDEPAISKKQTPENLTDSSKTATTTTSKKQDKQGKKQQSSKFYFSLFAGIEGNGVNFPGLNKFSARAGFTVGYNLTNKLSIQTGFFAGSKKYVAGKDDYKPKAGSYWSTVDITKVDADCRVFEIPLAVRYDFSPSKKWNSFAAMGLSSYIMDKEDYAYDYIRYNNPYHAKASYKGNQHFFSVLRLSGGIEKKISKQFSFSANPGIAIPLAGVGEGQIKLFSSELLLSLKYRPFKK